MKNGLSRVEHLLTVHIRTVLQKILTPDQIRYISFVLALLTCLLDANVAVFSLFTPAFINHLKYTQVSINIIAGSMLIGLYLTLPLLGYLADSHGPVLLAIIGILVSPGYFFAWEIYSNKLSEWYMAITFFFIGMGTSSSYFCSLLTCARIFPDRKGLSISLPVACYGLSSFLLAWIFTWNYFTNEKTGKIHMEKVFIFLFLLYAIICIVNWLSSVVVSLEKEIVFAKILEEERLEDNEILNGNTNPNYGSLDNNNDNHNNNNEEIDEENGLLDAGVIKSVKHEDKFKAFLKDPSMKLVLISLFCLAGPLELFMSNLGSIIKNINGGGEKVISTQVAIFSISSTITRLSMGVLSDIFHSCLSTIFLIHIAVVFTMIGFGLVAINYQHLEIISVIIGIGYGTVFTMFPTLAATVWGVDILGSTWGLFLSAPAIGSVIFGLFYAIEYDSKCESPQIGGDSFCLKTPFLVFILVAFVGGVCIQSGWQRYWKKRGCL